MDEERKVRVEITKSDESKSNQSKKNDLEHFLTPTKKNKPTFRKQDLMRWLKPVVFAIVLGLAFGIGLMYFFSDFAGGEPAEPENEPVSTVSDSEEENENENTEGSSFVFDEMNFNLIQYGIFSSQSNAQDHLQNLKEQIGLPAFVMEEDNNFYVMGGYITSADEETQSIEWLENQGLVRLEDFLVKDWQTSASSVQASSEEQSWLETGLAFLNGDSFAWDQWNEWLQSMPDAYEEEAYAASLQTLTHESDETFMVEKSILLALLFFFSELE